MTTKQRVRKLKAEIADVEREIQRLKALPKIDVYKVLCEAFARGLRGDEPTPPQAASSRLDIRAKFDILPSMRQPIGKFPLSKLAGIYPVSRQRLHQVAQAYGYDILLDPDTLAARMLPDVFVTPAPSALIDALRDPAERRRIKSSISQLAPK